MGCKYCDQYPNARTKNSSGLKAVSNKRTKLRDLVLSKCTCGDLQPDQFYARNSKAKKAKTESPRQKDR